MADKRSKLPAGAGSEDTAAPVLSGSEVLAASGREAKVKTSEDLKLIKKLFDIVPLDWARYPDGKLVFISPDGSKAAYTGSELSARAESVDASPSAASSRQKAECKSQKAKGQAKKPK